VLLALSKSAEALLRSERFFSIYINCKMVLSANWDKLTLAPADALLLTGWRV
jgi:hypothetical protein